jgi:hypothetical protein
MKLSRAPSQRRQPRSTPYLFLPVSLTVLSSPRSGPQSGCRTGDFTWMDGCLLLGEEKTATFHSRLFLPVSLPVLSSPPSGPQSGCRTGDFTWMDGCLLLGEEKTATFHSRLFLPVFLPVLSCPRLAVALSQGVALETSHGWMDVCYSVKRRQPRSTPGCSCRSSCRSC